MTDFSKATRATVTIGAIAVEGFMLPDGSYCLSQTQAAEIVGLTERNAREFLRSKALKSLLGEGYTPATSDIEPEEGQARGGSRIQALPLEVVSAYWLWQAFRGNKSALPLCMALITESLERRFDAAFGISRTEAERDNRLSQRIQQLERDLQTLGDAYASDDVARWDAEHFQRENARLLKLLEENGIDPSIQE